jgi:hypothetical protein
VRTEARKVAGTLGEALGATFAGLGDEVRKAFNRRADQPAGDASATDGSTWAPPATPPAPPADGTTTHEHD